MARNSFQIGLFVTVLLAAAPAGMAATIFGALEDYPGSSGIENTGDFNDVIFEITGNVTIDAPGGIFNNLTSGVVNQSGTVFWDNPSGDGPNKNIGYCLRSEAACAVAGAPYSSLEYLATAEGGSVNDVTFDATGTVTLTLLGGITKNALNTLGWYDLDDPTVLNQLVAVPPDSVGDSVTFAPDGAFALYSSDGRTQVYSSVAGSNVGESQTQQHFAFFTEAASSVPEASTGVLIGLGLALLAAGRLRRKHR